MFFGCEAGGVLKDWCINTNTRGNPELQGMRPIYCLRPITLFVTPERDSPLKRDSPDKG
jgi:hypothetical protein